MANGPIPGEMHLNAGQEPVAVGVCAHLNPEDVVAAPRRPHHQASAKGMYPAVGAALSRKMQKTAGVGVAFVGEGAVNQDRWHEAMDLAAT